VINVRAAATAATGVLKGMTGLSPRKRATSGNEVDNALLQHLGQGVRCSPAAWSRPSPCVA